MSGARAGADPLASLPHWSFGDSPALADELLALVLAGKKTATCGAQWEYIIEQQPFPSVGGRSVLVDSEGRRRCLIETTEVAQKRFCDVDMAFAHDEGEGDRTLGHWRKAHETFFRRGGHFSDDMIVVCERFQVLRVLSLEAAP